MKNQVFLLWETNFLKKTVLTSGCTKKYKCKKKRHIFKQITLEKNIKIFYPRVICFAYSISIISDYSHGQVCGVLTTKFSL